MTDPSNASMHSAPHGGQRYQRSENFISRRVADEMLLIPVAQRSAVPRHRAGDLCVLNETGEFLWGLLSSPQGVEDMVRKLIQYFEVPPERARSDAERFIADLLVLEAIYPVEET